MRQRRWKCLIALIATATVAYAQPQPPALLPAQPPTLTQISPAASAPAPPSTAPAPVSTRLANLPNGDNASGDRSANSPLEQLLKPNFRLRGLIETESVVASQSNQSKASIGDLQNGYGFRRARLGAQGTIGDSARWISEVDLAGGSTAQLIDVFLGLTAIPGVREVRIGHFREPFSLEGATGVPAVTFLERSPLNQLDPTRNWGVAGFWWPESERITLALGAFRDGTNRGGQSIGDEDAWAYTGRITGLPIYEPDDSQFELVHLGVSASARSPSNGLVSFNPANAPSLLVVVDDPPTPFLPAVAIPASGQQLFNLQAAYVRGPWSFQGEWIATAIQQPAANSVFLHGIYGYTSYFLTGEHRDYDRVRGAFAPVKVLRPVTRSEEVTGGGLGAWELALRYSFFDFNSANLPTMNGLMSRGILHQLELGVNWYLNDFTRLMVNYTAGFPEVAGRDPTSAHVFGLRASIFW